MSTSTPWGAAQTSTSLARGIMSYATAGHGGIHLSPTRNMVVPEYMRSADGWYEEDCQWAIAATVYPEAFVKWHGSEDILETIKSTLLNWYPDAYEKFHGAKIEDGESFRRDRDNFDKTNRYNYIVLSATGKPEGVEVIAAIGGKRDIDIPSKRFLIPTEEYQNRSNMGFVIDQSRHKEI